MHATLHRTPPPSPAYAFAVLATLLVLLALGVNWYRAGVQRDVYARQGIQMSRWEVLLGTQPAEKTVHVRP